MESTNPAGRLHAILSRAQDLIGQSGQVATPINLWSQVFDLKEDPSGNTPNTHIVVISRLLQFRQLIEEAEQSLREIEGLPERYFRPFERIRSIPDLSLNGLNTNDISNSIRAVTEGDMTVLEFCSERLEERHAEPIVNEAELQEILQEVTVLFDEVKMANDLDPDLQTFILDGLESIRRAIYEFRIRGTVRLKDSSFRAHRYEVSSDVHRALTAGRDGLTAATKC